MKATTVVGVMVVQLLLFVSLSCLPMIQANTATAPSATAADMMPSMPYNGQEPLHALEEGRKWHSTLSREAKVDECIKQAFGSTVKRCADLADDAQRRLAIGLANCHLAKSNRPTYECTLNHSIAECTQGMTSDAFHTYTEFFTHVDNLCFYLQHRMWRRQTDELIVSLRDTALQTTARLTENYALGNIMLENQRESLANEAEMLASEAALLDAMEQAESQLQHHQTTVNASFDAISTRLQEDSVVFFELLDQLRSYASTALALHASIAGDIQYMKGVGWHAAAVLVAWCITAPTRARSARFWALVATFGIALVEWQLVTKAWHQFADASAIGASSIVVHLLVGPGSTLPSTVEELGALLHVRCWQLRWTGVALVALLVIHAAWTYRDFAVLNHELLKDLAWRLAELQQVVKKDGHGDQEGGTVGVVSICDMDEPGEGLDPPPLAAAGYRSNADSDSDNDSEYEPQFPHSGGGGGGGGGRRTRCSPYSLRSRQFNDTESEEEEEFSDASSSNWWSSTDDDPLIRSGSRN